VIVRLDFGGEGRRARALRVADGPGPGVQIIAQLGAHLPFKDSMVDEIFLDHALVHNSEDFVAVMEECWRVAKPGTIVHARLPHASSSWAMSRDPRHNHHYTLETFNYFDPRFRNPDCTSPATFQVEHARLYLTGARSTARGLALARSAFGRIIERLVNQDRGMQYRWERWFAPFVGGFEEFYVVLSTIKKPAFG
jgi:hypothetical protein